jgi:hypothetical protein
MGRTASTNGGATAALLQPAGHTHTDLLATPQGAGPSPGRHCVTLLCRHTCSHMLAAAGAEHVIMWQRACCCDSLDRQWRGALTHSAVLQAPHAEPVAPQRISWTSPQPLPTTSGATAAPPSTPRRLAASWTTTCRCVPPAHSSASCTHVCGLHAKSLIMYVDGQASAGHPTVCAMCLRCV